MTEDKKIKNILENAAPDISIIYLAEYLGRDDLKVSNQELPDLIIEALNNLPKSGSLDRSGDRYALKAIKFLINEIPEDHPKQDETLSLLKVVVKRLDI